MTAENVLTHWSRVTHLCVGNLTIIGSDNGLSPGRRQAIIRTNAGILLIRPLGTNFSECLVEILIFSFKKMRLKVSSAKRRPFCLGLNELTHWSLMTHTGLKQLGHHWYRQCFVAYLTHLANKLPILNREITEICYTLLWSHIVTLGPVLLTFLRHAARISANGIAAFLLKILTLVIQDPVL